MRRQRGLVGLMGLAALVALGVAAQPVAAKVTTERKASILIFPKVIANGVRDTIIQITNTSNMLAHAHCFYVNGAPTIPGLPVGPSNPPLWTEIDFDIWLTKQQPTHWVVSRGRLDDISAGSCRGVPTKPWAQCDPDTNYNPQDCCDAGFPPGRVPPVVPDFTGELKCIEVDANLDPVPANSLIGEATLVDVITGDVSKYNPVGIEGNNPPATGGVLCLGDTGVVCPTDQGTPNYSSCPSTWLLDHPAVGAPSPIVEQQPFCKGYYDEDGDNYGHHPCSSVGVNLTVVPCTENFETQNPPPITLQFVIINEFEQALSVSTTFRCWQSYNLEDISSAFLAGTIGGKTLQTRMRTFAAADPTTGQPSPLAGGVAAVLEETHVQCPDPTRCAPGTQTVVSRAATNGHASPKPQTKYDLITIPTDQLGLGLP